MRKIQRYGWKRDLPDHRDRRLLLAPPTAPLPSLVDLRGQFEPPIYDQGDLGSCTANAIAGAFEAELLKQGLKDFMPSRLFIYMNERIMEGDPDQDNGAQIRDGMKSIATLGVCSEEDWPYDITKFAVKPPDSCYQSALANVAKEYLSIPGVLSQIKPCLAAGFRVPFGISVFESFESQAVAQSGMVPLPGADEECIGGHAVCCSGYDDSKQCFIMRNSWGTGWGDKGYFYLPYAYVIDQGLASDFWTIRLVI